MNKIKERNEDDVGRICSSCNHKIYFDNVGDIECKCGDVENDFEKIRGEKNDKQK